MMIHSVLSAVGLSLVVSLAQATTVGRTEMPLLQSAVVHSASDPLEVVIRLTDVTEVGARIDVGWIELDLDVDGEMEGFVPFTVVVDAVVPSGPQGAYEPAWPYAAREVILAPAGQTIRLDATRIWRRWRAEGGELLLRLRAVEPAGSERPSGSIRLSPTGGVLGKAVLVTR